MVMRTLPGEERGFLAEPVSVETFFREAGRAGDFLAGAFFVATFLAAVFRTALALTAFFFAAFFFVATFSLLTCGNRRFVRTLCTIGTREMDMQSIRFMTGLLAFAFAGSAAAQAYPSKPVRWIVPFAAGGPMDVLTRAIAQPLSVNLGQPVVVEIRASASGIVGAELVAKAPPDGYSILTHGSRVPQKFLYKSLPYDIQKDFAPITMTARAPMVLYIHESVPAKSVKEFVAHAKGNPGKLAYASSGSGQPFHLAFEMFKGRTGTDLLHVPYKGAATVIPEILSGRVQATFFNAVEQLLAQVKTGKLRALAVVSDKRMPDLPDVPTFEEAGLKDFDPTGWVAASTTAGVPRDVVDRLNRDLVKASGDPETLKVYDRLRMQRLATTPEQMAQRIRDDIERWGPLIKALGVTLD